MSYIINAAPMVIDLGIQDLSTRRLPREPEAIPQHCPKFYIFSQKGPKDAILTSGVEMTNMYGMDTFDPRKKYFNYSTQFVIGVNAKANMMMIERVIPEDAGPESNMTLWLDVLETTVDTYQRNIDGSIVVDVLGNPVKAGTTIGYKVKWVKTYHNTVVDAQKYALATILPGNQTDANGNQSTRYPIFEFKAGFIGEYANNSGLRIWAPNSELSPGFPTTLMAQNRVFPYYLSVVRKENPTTAPITVDTLFGEKYISFVVKKETIDPTTDARMYIGDKFVDAYQNLADVRYPATYGDFGGMAIYQNNIDYLLELFFSKEIPFVSETSDFTDDPEDKYLFNFLSGTNSIGIPYHSFQMVEDLDTVLMSEYANIYAGGGSDGTLNNETYSQQVINHVKRYADKMDQLMELAVNVESIIYDTGFRLDVKKALCYFISQRKDTMVVLATHDVSDRVLQPSEEQSLAVALRTRLQMFPESEYFGTPVTRGMVIGRSGLIRNAQFTKRMPLSYEVALKAAAYMGAANGIWKTGKHFDGAPGSILEAMYDISIKWVPTSVRNRHWDVGLNWVQSYDRRSFFFPAFKTVYDDDTSVLNSFITVMACCQLNKVAHACWREFSGVSYLTNIQLLERVNNFVVNRTIGRFDNRFVITPAAYINDMDALRGYSWHLPIKIYSPMMKTVMITNVTAFRIDPDTPVYTSSLTS